MTYRDRPGSRPPMRDSDEGDNVISPSDARRNGLPSRRSRPARDPFADAPWHADAEPGDDYSARDERDPVVDLPRSSPRRPDLGEPPLSDSRAVRQPARAQRLPPAASSRYEQPLPSTFADEEPWPELDQDWAGGEPEDDEAYDDSAAYLPPRRARRAGRSRAGARRPRAARTPRPLPQVKLPRFVTGADVVTDHTALTILAVTAFGAAVMWAVLGNRLGALGPSVVLHVDASGLADRWGPPKSLWRIPLLATMIALMNLVVAWFVSPFDRFAGRFLLATALGVQVIVWVAAIRFLW